MNTTQTKYHKVRQNFWAVVCYKKRHNYMEKTKTIYENAFPDTPCRMKCNDKIPVLQ